MSVLQKLVDIALNEVGTMEVGGNNLGPRVRTYQTATWLEPGPWPWCAAFTCWCLRQWLKDEEVVKAISATVAPKFDPEWWRCKDASAFGWEKWAKKRGLQVLPETEKAKLGDFIIFDFSHIGIVVEDQYTNHIVCCEGNTNGSGARDSETGDGVWKKSRHFSLAKSFVRIL